MKQVYRDMLKGTLAEIFPDLRESVADEIAEELGDHYYFCTECDEAGRLPGDGKNCPEFPARHDETGYIGSGFEYAAGERLLARAIAANG